MKIIINGCFGGFGWSARATLELYKRGASIETHPVDTYYSVERDPTSPFSRANQLANWREAKANGFLADSLFLTVFNDDETLVLSAREIKRDDPIAVALLEEKGSKWCSGRCAQLEIVEIPDGVKWQIEEYDGNEHVAEQHRTWG